MGKNIPAFERALSAARGAWGDAWQPAYGSRAPGRLELLGNHIDYNGGPVLAAAIDRSTVCLVRPTEQGREDEFVFPDVDAKVVSVSPRELVEWRATSPDHAPLEYVRGVIAAGLAAGLDVRTGLQVAVAGDVPLGFGLSSSAALCVSLGLVLFDTVPAPRDLVLLAQDGEVRSGTPCGTMDQSASVGGNVILYDGSTTTWQSIEPDLDGFVFAVADSGVSHRLSASSYPVRVRESRDALSAINDHLGADYPNLASVPPAALDRVSLTDPLDRRARHVITETARVRAGAEAMRGSDWVRFGALMSESGASSAGDYAISHPRVEQIVGIAKSIDGVAGARMMGGGEGGAALILVRSDAVQALREALARGYYEEWGTLVSEPVQVFGFSPGAERLAI